MEVQEARMGPASGGHRYTCLRYNVRSTPLNALEDPYAPPYLESSLLPTLLYKTLAQLITAVEISERSFIRFWSFETRDAVHERL